MKRACVVWLLLLVALTGCSGGKSEPSWVEDEVSFVADGLTIHGTYRHPRDAEPAAAALLISESGRTDRNGDNAVAGPVGNMRQLAEYLSGHGVASLRYDKVGTGATGLGPYAAKPAEVGSAVYTAGAKAALGFLAGQPGTDKARLSAYGLGEGVVQGAGKGVCGLAAGKSGGIYRINRAAALHDHNAVGKVAHCIQVVGDDEYGLARVCQRAQVGECHVADFGV